MAYQATPIPLGTRIGRLTVVSGDMSGGRYRNVLVRCDCGAEKLVKKINLTGKKPVMSCGHCDGGRQLKKPLSEEHAAAISAGHLRRRGRIAFYQHPPSDE